MVVTIKHSRKKKGEKKVTEENMTVVDKIREKAESLKDKARDFNLKHRNSATAACFGIGAMIGFFIGKVILGGRK